MQVLDAACNCITYWIKEAEATDAAVLDQPYALTGTVVGPLHGIPWCVKDHFAVNG
jgi:Asp-tRNA(Asn)/Glu-tRNA(Gln) amidotransferase A subunit family amidase